MSDKLQVLLFLVGGLVSLLVLIAVAFSRFYQRSTADEALVRTGAGGVRVYIGEGAFVMPVLHQIMRVSLKSIKLMVDRAGKQHALVTADRIKANVTTELYVKVEAIEESVRAAARSFGSKNLDQHVVSELIEGKLTDALRSAAANKTFNDLHQNRSEFADAIKKTLADELKHNGLILENVSITSFAMLPVTQLDPSDVFDAEGMRAITETVQLNLERTNQIKTEKANAIEAQNVIARKKSLALTQEQAQAEADQRRQVAEYGARQEAETAQAVFIQQQAKELARIEQEKAVQQADLARQAEVAKAEASKRRMEKEAQIATEKALQAAEIAKQKEIEAATIEKQKAVQAAEIERQKVLEASTIAKQQAVETATIAKQIAVLKSEEEAARASAAKAVATAEEEAATQNIVTVEETAKANREKQIALIKSDEEAQRSKIAAEREAFRIRLEAETAAAGKKAVADGDLSKAKGAAESLRVEAEGRAAAQVKEAEGKANAAVREAAAITTLAEANRKKGEAEAEVRRLLVEAENSVSTKLLLRDLAMKAIEVLPDVTRELMAPAQHISEIKVLQMQNGSGGGTDANGQSLPMGAASPVLKTILEAGAAYPLMRELMNFAQVDSGTLANKARGFLQTLPAELKTVIEQDPAIAAKLATVTSSAPVPPTPVEIQPMPAKPVIAGPKA